MAAAASYVNAGLMIDPPNPAVLSDAFRALFPDGVVAAELREPGDAALLLPAEAACLGRAAPKRIQEFAAGRLCARRALAEFGRLDFAVCVGSDRQPLWPAGMVGSITHTAGVCAAVVGDAARFAGLGLDCEHAAKVNPDLWPKICGPRELRMLGALPRAQQAPIAALIFAAKEAFYKCQYPITAEFLGFHDLHVEPADWSAPQGQFDVEPERRIAIAGPADPPFRGRYRFHEEYVSAGVALPAVAVR
jgi:4'-phosphopantetheinyl transferase EntD